MTKMIASARGRVRGVLHPLVTWRAAGKVGAWWPATAAGRRRRATGSSLWT
jgi:hypothetical protein